MRYQTFRFVRLYFSPKLFMSSLTQKDAFYNGFSQKMGFFRTYYLGVSGQYPD